MKRRYCDYMNEIQPSEALVSRLERDMLRELRRKNSSSMPKTLTAVAASAAVLAIALIGFRAAKPPTDVVARPPAAATHASTDKATDAPTLEPTAAPTATAEPSPTTASAYPADDIRLELEMSDERAFPRSSIGNLEYNLFNDHLAGSSTHGSHIVEIHQSADLNAVVVAPLQPGTAYWPMNGDGSIAMLTDAKGKEVGYAERVQYLDEKSNTLREGWKHTVHSDDPLPEVSDNPVESVQLPGKVKAGGTLVRYGRSADAPAVATLEKDQLVAIGYRVGNWLYVSTEPFCFASDTPAAGWIHISEAVGMGWRTPISQVDLTAKEINLRQTPDGEKIYTLNQNTPVTYGGATIPGKTGDWHFVSASIFSKEGLRTGYVSADYANLNTFRLESELDMDGVVSATLNHTAHGEISQSVTGEKLAHLLERLKNALSESVYTEVCSEGTAILTLTYADGRAVDLLLSGDSCTQIRFGAVTYDLKTDSERAERFLNDGGVSLEDILGPVFDEIFASGESQPLQMSDDAAWMNAVSLGFGKQMLGLSGGRYPLEIRSEPSADAPVIATLQPGTAHWPTYADQVRLDDTGYFEEIQWWDGETNQLRTGWMLEIYGSGAKDDPVSPLEDISLPGRIAAESAPLRYGPSEEAPIVATMPAGRISFLCARDGDWIFAAHGDYPAPVSCGWIHVSDVEALQFREPLNRIDLLADEVEIFGDPDGSVAAVMTPDKAQNGFIAYMGTTLSTDAGKWHHVGYRERYEDDTSYGFVQAGQTQIYTFTLADELSLDGAASATLIQTVLDPYSTNEQTVEGERLSALIGILENAYSEEVYRPFSNGGSLALRLTFSDGRVENLVLDGDGEPRIRFGDVTYDLRSDAQRAGDFLNGGNTLLSDLLSPIFDQIKIP